MKVIRSLLLGSAAGLLTVAGAQAADLPTRKAAPINYVRICDAYGAGFFYIPGTETCLKVGGLALFETRIFNTPYSIGAGIASAAGGASNLVELSRARSRVSRRSAPLRLPRSIVTLAPARQLRVRRSRPYRTRCPHGDGLRHAARLHPCQLLVRLEHDLADGCAQPASTISPPVRSRPKNRRSSTRPSSSSPA